MTEVKAPDTVEELKAKRDRFLYVSSVHRYNSKLEEAKSEQALGEVHKLQQEIDKEGTAKPEEPKAEAIVCAPAPGPDLAP